MKLYVVTSDWNSDLDSRDGESRFLGLYCDHNLAVSRILEFSSDDDEEKLRLGSCYIDAYEMIDNKMISTSPHKSDFMCPRCGYDWENEERFENHSNHPVCDQCESSWDYSMTDDEATKMCDLIDSSDWTIDWTLQR